MDVPKIRENISKQIELCNEQGKSYNNIIIAGGYIGYATIFQSAKDYVEKTNCIYSVILVFISLMTFIVWEVAKQFIITSYTRHLQAMMLKSDDELLAGMPDLISYEKKYNRLMYVFYIIVFLMTCIFGMGGALFFLVGLIRAL